MKKLGIALLAVATLWAFWSPVASQVDPGTRVDAASTYNPVLSGEVLPAGFRQLLPRDAIAPVYDPVFVPAHAAGWPGGAQIIGVAFGESAKAYPVSFLNRREMVIDSLAGIPILVTW